MDKDPNRMIIVEGTQGTGKTSLTDYLRSNIPAASLFSLSGQKDKGLDGKKLSEYMYKIQIEYLEKLSFVPMDLIFDRTFFTEEVYARLGYKDYSFTDVYNKLVNKLEKLNYEIYLTILYLNNPELYLQRLKRKQHHNYQKFSIQSSIDQQRQYLQIAEELKNSSINIFPLAMDNFDEAYKKADKVFKIGRKSTIRAEEIGKENK